jgi:hypothetical protein
VPDVTTPRGLGVNVNLDNTKHGKTGTYTHDGWCQWRARCRTQQDALHGPWDDYLVFLHDVGKRPLGTSLVRLDASRPWGPGNVRWARYNRRTNEWE